MSCSIPASRPLRWDSGHVDDPERKQSMQLPSPLMPGRLLRRYKRFLADVELDDGQVVTAHTPNTGSMRQCAVPGHEVLLSASDNPRRKLAWSWELVRVNGGWTDINTHRANRVVEEGLRQGLIEGLAGYQIIPEYRFGQSRLDFSLERGQERDALLRAEGGLFSGRGDCTRAEASSRTGGRRQAGAAGRDFFRGPTPRGRGLCAG